MSKGTKWFFAIVVIGVWLLLSSVIKQARDIFSDFKQDEKFNRIMKWIKNNPSIHKKRFLDVVYKTGMGKDYYSTEIF